MSVHVFLGPTLSAGAARELAAEAGVHVTIHPPARCGDLLRLLTCEPAARDGQAPDVLLIDGVYERVPALWHKEILAVLAAGGRVIGCASMGALRAAECAPWGAQPTGSIAAEYLSGTRTSDADVAVAHAGEQDGYRSLSVPLVDADAACEQALSRGILTPGQAAGLRARARATFYARRTWAGLLDGTSERTARRMRAEILTLPGRKEHDARDALTGLRQLLTQPVQPRHDPAGVLPTQQLDMIRATVPYSPDAELLHRLEQRPGWPELLRAGLIRALLAAGAIPGLPRPDDQEAVTALAEQLGLPGEDAIATLAGAWQLPPARVIQLGREQVQLAHLWSRHGARARAHVIDHLRITGTYPGTDDGKEDQQ